MSTPSPLKSSCFPYDYGGNGILSPIVLNVHVLVCLKMKNQHTSRQEKQIISSSFMRSVLSNT